MTSESERHERFVGDPLECVGGLKVMLKNRLPFAISADRNVRIFLII
jgi:hypothetical protein